MLDQDPLENFQFLGSWSQDTREIIEFVWFGEKIGTNHYHIQSQADLDEFLWKEKYNPKLQKLLNLIDYIWVNDI